LGAERLAAALENNSSLTTLELARNQIGDSGAKRLADALKKNYTLATLILSGNSIQAQGVERLAGALVKNTTLTTLGLGHNSIQKTSAKGLAAALEKNSTLTTLFLDGNFIGTEAAERFAAALETNRTLTTLKLTGDSYKSHGAGFAAALERLAAAVERNNAGTQVLTVDCSVLETHRIAIVCRDLAGEPIVTAELAPTDGLTELLAVITSLSRHNGHLQLVLPDGCLLEDSSGTRTLSELLLNTLAPALSDTTTSAQAPDADKRRKTLQKKLKQIADLEEKQRNGRTLDAEQTAKVASKAAIEAEIKQL